MNPNTKYWPLLICQLIGGLAGTFLTFKSISENGLAAFYYLPIYVLFIGLYAFNFFCCLRIYTNPHNGLVYSRVNQWLQFFGFYIYGWGFRYIAEPYLTLAVNINPRFEVGFNYGLAAWQLNFNQHSNVMAVEFNLVALFFIFYCDRQIKKSEELNLINSFDIKDLDKNLD